MKGKDSSEGKVSDFFHVPDPTPRAVAVKTGENCMVRGRLFRKEKFVAIGKSLPESDFFDN